jgi:hypothetical protein
MTGLFLPAPVLRAVDQNGAPLPGALLQFYLTGTTTPTNVYTDKTLGTPLSNPVVADAGGLFAPIFLDPTVSYRCQLLTSAASLIRDIDPVAAPTSIAANSITSAMLQAGVAVANIGYTPLNKAGDTATNLLISATSLSPTSAGYLGAPVNEQDANYTLVLADAGRMVRANNAGAMAYTIPASTFPLGATLLIRNCTGSLGVLTITRGSGVVLVGAGGTTNKDWALAVGGIASIIREASNDTWVVTGTGLS